MNDFYCDPKSLLSESDVEQKVIWPLLTKGEPIGLGYTKADIQTKINLRKLEIDKGAKSQLYYPDYLLSLQGVPQIIVEAKKPNEDLHEAYRQASLYASEINRYFEAGINPCKYIIACDGLKLVAGTWDEAKFQFEIEATDWLPTHKDFGKFLTLFSYTNLNKVATETKNSIRRNVQFRKPLYLVGSSSIQNKQTVNTFGETISISYQHLFNPLTDEEKTDIVKNAYVKVYKHESHLTPIQKIIKKKLHPSFQDTTEIDDNTNPKEISNKLRKAHKYNNKVLLLVGSVGSGKSTFITYLKEVALKEGITNKLFWANLDLNNAPVSRDEIYKWIKQNLIAQIHDYYSHIDFDSYEVITKVYAEEIAKFDKIAGALLSKESEKYKSELYDSLKRLQADIDITLNSLIREIVNADNKELIIVLDNCDKRNLEEQLLMFEVANWLKDTIKSIVFLPLRDTTYDHFRNEKPLDTVIKDLTFRITPASLEKVIYTRIKYASRLSKTNSTRYYTLKNNIKVSYPAVDELYYLKSVLASLFQNNFFKKLLIGLAGSDLRKGIEIFTDFIKSGHISEVDILKMKQSKGEHKLSNHIVSKVFLRGNRAYYNDESSKIKNLFYSDPSDSIPNPFTRLSILKWLHSNYRIKGPSGIPGFHSTDKIISYLNSLGHDKLRVEKEILSLIRQKLLSSETQDSQRIKPNELVSITTSGIIHLDILGNLDYLSACSEDTWFEDVKLAEKIATNMAGEGKLSHLSLQNVLAHSEEFLGYLKRYFDKHFKAYYSFINDGYNLNPMDFDRFNSMISNAKAKLSSDPEIEIEPGTIKKCRILSIRFYGIIVQLDQSRHKGFIKANTIKDKDFETNYHLEQVIDLEVVKYNSVHGKYDMRIPK
ncbi:type I restriction endonuclease [Parasegetibacter sp. NRK P23]|uniref:type I restriction endonuclease n=1 Tax=Parasegetibacter sp. NRK P23 TaxID=2942999 RepID=UPI0020435C1B|nr:type I restriction endonuclease [Parasegetibacter sp. NRK P23]MCM5530250.1 hypothetical protein [Parasegetibacter sp. NRK P23]